MERVARGDSANWRRAIRWRLICVLLAKLGLLTLLWALCFSPSHRNSVNATAISRHLAVSAATAHAPLDRGNLPEGDGS
jgi:hypothetical protein